MNQQLSPQKNIGKEIRLVATKGGARVGRGHRRKLVKRDDAPVIGQLSRM